MVEWGEAFMQCYNKAARRGGGGGSRDWAKRGNQTGSIVRPQSRLVVCGRCSATIIWTVASPLIWSGSPS